jgi:hypothetical protein
LSHPSLPIVQRTRHGSGNDGPRTRELQLSVNAYMISIGKEDRGSKGLMQGGLSSSPPESPRVCSPANPGVLAAGCAKQDEEK